MERPYCVVSCHVEQPLDDRAWNAFAAFQESRPSGLAITALLRPPDAAAGEDEELWLERAREAAGRGPLGHHTHYVGPEHARQAEAGPEHAERVRREAAWFRERGLEPRFFCGGGWFIDEGVAAVLSELGYVDCTATAFRPGYLPLGASRLAGRRPTWLTQGGARLLELPTTHSIGMAFRAAFDPKPLGPLVHVYFHDTDLLSTRRRLALRAALTMLARRCEGTDLARLADEVAADAPERDYLAAIEPASAP